jgi:hypothetical protein
VVAKGRDEGRLVVGANLIMHCSSSQSAASWSCDCIVTRMFCLVMHGVKSIQHQLHCCIVVAGENHPECLRNNCSLGSSAVEEGCPASS